MVKLWGCILDEKEIRDIPHPEWSQVKAEVCRQQGQQVLLSIAILFCYTIDHQVHTLWKSWNNSQSDSQMSETITEQRNLVIDKLGSIIWEQRYHYEEQCASTKVEKEKERKKTWDKIRASRTKFHYLLVPAIPWSKFVFQHKCRRSAYQAAPDYCQ